MDHHIDHHFDEILGSLKQQILLMGSKVEEMVTDSLTALKNHDSKLAEKIISADRAVNALEVAIDEQCVHILARYQPAAGDLRFVTRGIKIVTDLERIADLAVNMAQRVEEINKYGFSPLDLTQMAATVQSMLKKSLAAFVNGDIPKAEDVLLKDDIVDDMTEKYVMELLERSSKEPQHVGAFFPMASVVRYLERITDHSTNIAELTIYMIKGCDIRHGGPH